MRKHVLYYVLAISLILIETLENYENVKENIANKVKDKYYSKLRFLDGKKQDSSPSLACKACVYTFSLIQKAFKTRPSKYMLKMFLEIGCLLQFSKDVCEATTNYFSETVINGIILRDLNPGYLCHSINICPNSEYYTELNPNDFADRVLKDKPINSSSIKHRNDSKTFNFIQISDVHIDPKYSEGSNGNCDDFQICCRIDSKGKAKSAYDIAGPWGYVGLCDLPIKTLNVSLDYMNKHIKPEFVIWTGDNPSHEFMNMNTSEGIQSTVLVSRIMMERFPDTIIYPILGNHEKVPLDQFDIQNPEKERGFLRTIGNEWKSWIGEEAYQSFISYGFYTTLHKNTTLRILSINSFLWDNFNFYLINNPTDPLKQIDWLENTLRIAENNNETVLIIGHIPPGNNYFNSEASRRYIALIDRFSHIISGQLYGHSHSEEFKIIKEYYNDEKIAGIVHTCGSLTTNPGFRVYQMYEENYFLKDFSMYYLNITTANFNKNITPQFEIGYNASEFYNLTYLNDFEKYQVILDKMMVDKDFFERFSYIYFGFGEPHVDLVPNPNSRSNNDEEDLKYFFYCRFNKAIFEDYVNCMGKRKTWDGMDAPLKFSERLMGKWHTRKEFD